MHERQFFNERAETFTMRAEGMGLDLAPLQEAGLLQLHQINTGSTPPSEFDHQVRRAVEDDGVGVIMIDSLSGYISAMLQRHLLVSQMHELVTYLSQRGILTLLVVDQNGPSIGADPAGPTHVSYLADSVLLLRYQEWHGLRRRTISVLKLRHGAHALDARELHLTDRGLAVGETVDGFVGLTLDPPIFATLHPHGASSDGEIPSEGSTQQ